MKWPTFSSSSGRVRRPRFVPRERFGARFVRFVGRVAVCVAVAAVVAAGCGATAYVRRFIRDSDFFRIEPTQIAIGGASATLNQDALERLRTLLPAYGNNLMRLDTRALARELAALPRARAAKVSKVYPQGLSILFEERDPLMLVNLDQPYLLDREGILLAKADPAQVRALGLPVLTGVRGANHRPGDRLEQPRLADVLQAVQFIRYHDGGVNDAIAEWNINGMEEVTAILHGGTSVRFGTQPPLALLDKLSAVISRKPQLTQQAEYIDLRMERQIVYNMRNGY